MKNPTIYNDYITILRPKQWLKNGLILFPAFFSLSILNVDVFTELIVITLGFCLLASAIYIFNDISDIKGDLLHPSKKNKPIASGKISRKIAISLYLILLVTSISIISLTYAIGFYFCLAYIGINLVYSKGFKHFPFIDILMLSLGYLIRIYLGGFAIGIEVSLWLSVLVFLMAVYILIAKRRDDVLIYRRNQQVIRKHIHFYKKLNFSLTLYSLSLIIISVYGIYTFSEVTFLLFKTTYLWITIPFAALGLFTFTFQILKIKDHIEPIAVILKSKIIVFSLLAWFFIFGWIIYG